MALSSSKGYTLTEAMLTVAIVGVITAFAGPMLVQMTNFWKMTSARNTIQRDVRESLEIIDRFTRQAKSGTVTIDRAPGQPPNSRISFTNVQNQSVTFYQSGNKLYMTLGGGRVLLSSNISYIAFVYPRTDDVSILSVAITIQSPTYMGGRKALQLSVQKVRVMN